MKKLLLLHFLVMMNFVYAQGKVYFIIGSDTAIWDAMDVAKYTCHYNYNVIPDNTRNYFNVMQSSYREKFSDSFGNQLKLTWWLMCGNIFRYADNKNVPYPNVMVPYIAKKYYGNQFTQFNDELSLHYHTFVWTDYDGDGKYWWNQAKNFNESKDDFYYTLAQLLIEENIFPVSFRSGWNYMDNEWQAELDKLLPFSMHNEAPSYHVDNAEPLDNNYDWRLAPNEFIPYKPSPQNYQLKGNGKGWDLHSKYVGSISQNYINNIFDKAKTQDQVVCLWGHVWDDTFPENVLKVDSLAHSSAALYPSVQFKYCTATEGMQLWLNNSDTTAPKITLHEITSGNKVRYQVQTDEMIFQSQPFMALKYLDESYHVVQFSSTGNNEWLSDNQFDKTGIVKAAVAVTDTTGNLSKKIISYLQDDIYVDNEDAAYSELNGTWSTENSASWGLNSRKSILQANDSSKVRWQFKIDDAHYYNFFVQIPKADLQCSDVTFRIYNDNRLVESKEFTSAIPSMDWVYIATVNLIPSANNFVEMVAKGNRQESKILSADVLKISPLVRQKWLSLSLKNVDLGSVIKGDTATTKITISNNGIENLTITDIYSKNNFLFTNSSLPIVLPSFGKIELTVNFKSSDYGKKVDTLFFKSDDSFTPIVKLPFIADVTAYFKIVDNEELNLYQEFGNWAKSVAQAYGSTSRYAYLNQSPRPYAIFTVTVPENAFYNVSFIVPKTVNASNNALYVIQQENNFTDSVYVDQNLNSGNWVILKNCYLKGGPPLKVKIIDNGKATAGDVLRADAVKVNFTSYTTNVSDQFVLPTEFYLYQNYPNPFNPNTTIRWQLPVGTHVILKIFDTLGREIAILVNEFQQAGLHSHTFTCSALASGVYYYSLISDGKLLTKKMVLVK